MSEEAYKELLRNLTKTARNKVYLIVGSPGSGKTSLVQRIKKDNDLVFDFDLICAALNGSSELHKNHSVFMGLAMKIREVVYEEISKGGKWDRAYVITSSSDRQDVDRLSKMLNAEAVVMDTSRDVCLERVKNDKTRTNTDEQVNLVNSWYDKWNAQKVQE